MKIDQSIFHPDYNGSANKTMFSASDGGIFTTRNPRATVGGHPLAVCDPLWSNVVFEDLNNNMGITQFYHGTPYPGGDRYIAGTQDGSALAIRAGRRRRPQSLKAWVAITYWRSTSLGPS